MTKLDKEIAEITRENLLSANTVTVDSQWADWRKEYTIEMMEELAKQCD